MYPNPVLNTLVIQSMGKDHDYSLLNTQGQIVQKGILNATKKELDLSSLPVGIYLLNVGDIKTHKIVKH